MTHQLPRLTARNGESHAINDVIQAPLQLLQEHFAGHALGADRLLKVVAELPFLGEVNAFGLLLFAQLQPVSYDLGLAVFAMLTRSKVALLDRAFIAEALGAFEE